jgi:hypothetical protein
MDMMQKGEAQVSSSTVSMLLGGSVQPLNERKRVRFTSGDD